MRWYETVFPKLILFALPVLFSVSAVCQEVNPCAPDYDGPRGMLRGRVFVEEDSLALEYANVVVVDVEGEATCGALSGADGGFQFSLPPGFYEVKCLYLGYRPMTSRSVQVRAGEVTAIDCALVAAGLSAAEAAPESLGVDVDLDQLHLDFRIAPSSSVYRVGDELKLILTIRNAGNQAVVLPAILDASMNDGRYPKVQGSIDGPTDGVEFREPFLFCANMNRLRSRDLVEVLPGEEFKPHPGPDGAMPVTFFAGPFTKPGEYIVHVRFLMDEPDLRKWWGWPAGGPVESEISSKVRRLPLVTLTATCKVTVDP